MPPTLKQSNILGNVISRVLKLTKVGESVAISTVVYFCKYCSSQIYPFTRVFTETRVQLCQTLF